MSVRDITRWSWPRPRHLGGPRTGRPCSGAVYFAATGAPTGAFPGLRVFFRRDPPSVDCRTGDANGPCLPGAARRAGVRRRRRVDRGRRAAGVSMRRLETLSLMAGDRPVLKTREPPWAVQGREGTSISSVAFEGAVAPARVDRSGRWTAQGRGRRSRRVNPAAPPSRRLSSGRAVRPFTAGVAPWRVQLSVSSKNASARARYCSGAAAETRSWLDPGKIQRS